MSTLKREKVKSTSFLDFIRYASISEKHTFFEKVRDLAIEDQRQVIAKAEELKLKKTIVFLMTFRGWLNSGLKKSIFNQQSFYSSKSPH